MNNWTLSGNLGKDAEQRFNPAGESIVNFSIPAKSGYGKSESVMWIRCSLFGKRGESLIDYLKKGTSVVVSGELGKNEWTTKEGEARTDLTLRVNQLTLIGGKRNTEESSEKGSERAKHQKAKQNGFEDMQDDVPF